MLAINEKIALLIFSKPGIVIITNIRIKEEIVYAGVYEAMCFAKQRWWRNIYA
jgi:hypothetical protein